MKMEYSEYLVGGVSVMQSTFGQDNAKEIYATIQPFFPGCSASGQIQAINNAIECIRTEDEVEVVFVRFFMSDIANQGDLICRDDYPYAISLVQQPPIVDCKVAALLYAISGTHLESRGATRQSIYKRGKFEHIYTTGLVSSATGVYSQTSAIFGTYLQDLDKRGYNLLEHCTRTWLYVQGVDLNYAGMVHARNEIFDRCGLTSQTHYIASTGIEGRSAAPEHLVLLDAYAIGGEGRKEVYYLKGSSHLNPTHEYGVAFERGTVVRYGDRRHIFISGTASIDNRGDILHPRDIVRQTERTLENISVLLDEGGATLSDLTHMIIYLRDLADYAEVNATLPDSLYDIPKIFVWAPVCRPGWLIEIEGIAIAEENRADLDRF